MPRAVGRGSSSRARSPLGQSPVGGGCCASPLRKILRAAFSSCSRGARQPAERCGGSLGGVGTRVCGRRPRAPLDCSRGVTARCHTRDHAKSRSSGVTLVRPCWWTLAGLLRRSHLLAGTRYPRWRSQPARRFGRHVAAMRRMVGGFQIFRSSLASPGPCILRRKLPESPTALRVAGRDKPARRNPRSFWWPRRRHQTSCTLHA